jgi:hypothetical protein
MNHDIIDTPKRCLVYHNDGEGPCLYCRNCGWIRPSDRDFECTGSREGKRESFKADWGDKLGLQSG